MRLITRLENQSELNQMADLGALNVDGFGGTGGSEIVREALEAARIWVMIAR